MEAVFDGSILPDMRAEAALAPVLLMEHHPRSYAKCWPSA